MNQLLLRNSSNQLTSQKESVFARRQAYSNISSKFKISGVTNRGWSAHHWSTKFHNQFIKMSNNLTTNFGVDTPQSPKITAEKLRIAQPKLFSWRDIDDKITNSRGTSLPSQYTRWDDEEIHKRFNSTNKGNLRFLEKAQIPFLSAENCKSNNNIITIKKIKKKSKEGTLTPLSVNTNNTEDMNNNTDKNNYNLINNTNEENKYFQTIPAGTCDLIDKNSDLINVTKRDINSALPKNRQTKNQKYNNTVSPYKPITPTTRNDQWMPKGYLHYEKLVINPKLMKEEVNSNPFARKLPNISLKEIKEKSCSSDIFFRSSNTEEGKYPKFQMKYTDHQNSDIFNIKNDVTSISKTGEIYWIRPQKQFAYTTSQESKSEWSDKSSIPSLLNHTSSEWRLENPAKKNIGKTKEQIKIECKDKNPDVNPNFRQKGWCEYTDLTRVGAPNPNRIYRECVNKTSDCFMRRTDICGGFNDIHHEYKDLCDRPFVQPKFN